MLARLGSAVNDNIVTARSSLARSFTRSFSRGFRIDKAAIGEDGARDLLGEGLIARVIVESSWLSPSSRSGVSSISIISSSLPLSLNSGVIILALLRFIANDIIAVF